MSSPTSPPRRPPASPGAMLAAALEYAKRGISVVPLHTPSAAGCSCPKGPACPSPGKHVRVPWREYQQRRPSADELRSWWRRWPEANVGIVTGMVSGLAVLDVDPRNGGLDTLAELDAHNGRMPDDNPLVETGSGGLHHYFQLDAPLPKAAPFQGIEVQADGALVVAPPSLHKSGRRYRWLRPLSSPRALLPYWLRWSVDQVQERPAEPPVQLADASRDNVLGALHAAGLYLKSHRRSGLHQIRCPWAATHSNGDPEAVVTEPGASPAPGWGFRCLHAHCVERHIGDLLDVLGIPRRKAS